MDVERIVLEVMVIAHGMSPYEARNAINNEKYRTVASLDRPIRASKGFLRLKDVIIDHSSNPETILIEKEYSAEIEQRVQKLIENAGLTPMQRDVFEKAMEGLEGKDIAETLGFTGNNIKQRVHNLLARAIAKIVRQPDFYEITGLRLKANQNFINF